MTLSERFAELAAAEHNEGEIGGDAYEALHEWVTRHRAAIGAALALAVRDFDIGSGVECCRYCGEVKRHREDCVWHLFTEAYISSVDRSATDPGAGSTPKAPERGEEV